MKFPDQFSFSHLKKNPARFHKLVIDLHSKYVAINLLIVHYLHLLVVLLKRLHAIAEFCSFLKRKCIRGDLHLLFYFPNEIFSLTCKKPLYFLNRVLILLCGPVTRAVFKVIIKTRVPLRSTSRLVNHFWRHRTRTEVKCFPDGFQHSAHVSHMVVRPEILTPVPHYRPGWIYPGLSVIRNANVGIRLIIAIHNIVARLMFLDEVVF